MTPDCLDSLRLLKHCANMAYSLRAAKKILLYDKLSSEEQSMPCDMPCDIS